MDRTILSEDGRFEWEEEKDINNKANNGFSFTEILEIFDDPDFLEGFDMDLTGKENHYGIGCLNNILHIIAFYTHLERIRLISARRADRDEQKKYNDYFKKVKS